MLKFSIIEYLIDIPHPVNPAVNDTSKAIKAVVIELIPEDGVLYKVDAIFSTIG